MLGQLLVDALNDAGKDVVGQIGRDHGDGPAARAAALGDERAAPVLGAQIALPDERGKRLAHRLPAHLIARRQLVFRFDALPRPVPAGKDGRAQFAGDALGLAPVSVHAPATYVVSIIHVRGTKGKGKRPAGQKTSPQPSGRGGAFSPSR